MFSLIYYANTAANFLLYFLTANVFRQELKVMILSLPGCSKIVPEHLRAHPAHTISTGTGKLTAVDKTQLPMTPHDEDKANGVSQKQSGNPELTVHSTNRLLSVPNTADANSGISFDEDSQL